MKKHILGLGLAIGLGLSSSVAFADCEDIGSDEWNMHYVEMSKAINAGTNEIALQHALQLEMICKTDPVLLYSISELYNRMGREQESASYVRKASENLRGQTDIPQAYIEKIWFRRATLELPMRQELADAKAENEQLNAKLATATSFQKELTDDEMAFLEKLQWSGTGIAAGGAVLAVVGGVLFGMSYSKLKPCNSSQTDGNACSGKVIVNNSVNGSFGSEKNKSDLGVGLLGAGAALAVGGSILAIISHVKLNEIEIRTTGDENVTFNFDVSPLGAGMTMSF